MVQDVVSDLGHTPSTACNGAEAWQLYRLNGGADVVVSDWMMPHMDGAQLCRSVRSLTGVPYTYFIMLTALGDPEHRRAGMEAGADDYLPKPFNVDEIEARLIAAERVTALHRRREALLRQARRVAAEDDPRRLLQDLLNEAVHLVGGTAGLVTRWDEARRVLVPVAPNLTDLDLFELDPSEGASGHAARDRVAMVINDAVCSPAEAQAMGLTGPCATIAVPLLHEGRLIGTLTVSSNRPGQAFSRQDAELLELLASTTSAAVVALERARLEGVLLAARTAQHELNNQLALAKGYAELLVGSPELPPQLAELAEEVMRAADDAANIIRQLRAVSRIREVHWPTPSDTTIDLTNSATAPPRGRHGTRRASGSSKTSGGRRRQPSGRPSSTEVSE